MTTVVVMPGGFHPFHAGHMALYNSARRVFPDAEVYVAATNDTSSRPFPFAIKEKLAKLAGVEPGHFVQVKSPFRAEEITAKFDPAKDTLIFVRSEKDAGSQPKPGGVKKDGSPAYLQPLLGAKKLEPFAKHAYMAYLPTVEFGPGMTSATQIRTAWPTLDERRKTALVMSLYPATQSNPKLAATVRKMLDTAIVGDSVAEGSMGNKIHYGVNYHEPLESGDKITWFHSTRFPEIEGTVVGWKDGSLIVTSVDPNSINTEKTVVKYRVPKNNILSHSKQGVEENQGWAATFTNERKQDSKDIPAAYRRDPELYKLRQYAKQHYGQYSDDPEMAMMKLLQRGMEHSEVNDQQHDRKLAALSREIQNIRAEIRQQQQNEDYLEEKWSEKYKRSINCSNPKGFSQRAHCAGRKK